MCRSKSGIVLDIFRKSITGVTLALVVQGQASLLYGQEKDPPPPVTASKSASIWWKHATLYEIYPRSFADSNGDGVGDLNGITAHLDYLQWLGIDAIWIAPMYPSPQIDFGYDVSDYRAVDPQYGTMADFDLLLKEAKQRHIRVIMDMVLNHTSDKAEWFQESSKSRTNEKADWYVWSSGVPTDSPGVTPYQRRYEHDGMVPPNNWVSLFGGSAWEWEPARKQFYYHRFYKQQPDLNWRNPAVEAAMFGAMKFWLDRGVAGFRLDAITTLFEDPEFRNAPDLGGTNAQGDPNISSVYVDNLPEVHNVIRRMRSMVDAYPGHRVLIGETWLPNTRELDKWYGGIAHDELHLPMDMLVGFGKHTTLSAAYFRRSIEEVETQVHDSQPLLVFDNHDNVRSIDRLGDGKHDVEIAKLIAALLFMTRDTAMTYYGAPIGMRTTPPTRREDVKDPIGITGWPKEKGRDGERTPMQWTAGPQAGFSTNPRTWLPIPPNFKTINVQTEQADPDSLLNWYRKLILLRRNNRVLHEGGMLMLNTADPDVLSFLRRVPGEGKPVVVAINMSNASRTVAFDLHAQGIGSTRVRTLAASDPGLMSTRSLDAVTLPPYTAWIAEIQ